MSNSPSFDDTPRASPDSRSAFRHRGFRYYATSRLVANLGSEMIGVAVGWQIYSITHRAIDLGYVGLAQFIPALTFSLPAGNVADRVNRARMVAVCDILLATAALALRLLATGPPKLWPMYGVLVLAGVARTFEAPASQALVPGLVPTEHLPNAITWSSTIWQVSTILGPALGGALYGAGGAADVYTWAALALAVSGILALAIRPRRSTERSTDATLGEWKRLLAGLRFVRTQPVLLEAASLDLFAVLLGGATALLPIYASEILHTGPLGLGLLRGAPAAGAAVMAVALSYRPLTRRAGPTMLACVALFGVATIVFGLSRSIGLSLGALLVLGASDMVSVVVRGSVMQLRTPDAMRGRVSAVTMMSIAASSELGAFESGITAAWFGAVPAVVLGGIGTLAIVAVYTFGFRALRRVDRMDEASPG